MINNRKVFKEIDKIMDCIDGNKRHPTPEQQLASLILLNPFLMKEKPESSYNVSKPFRNIFENRFVKGDLAEIAVVYILGQNFYHSRLEALDLPAMGTSVYDGVLWYYGIGGKADHDRLLAAVDYLADTNRNRTAEGFIEIGTRVAAADLMTNHCFDYPKDKSESVSARYLRQLDIDTAMSVRAQVANYFKVIFKLPDQFEES